MKSFLNKLKKENGKITVLMLIIIVVVVIIVCAIGFIGIESTKSKNKNKVVIQEAVKPEIEISINTLVENQSSVILTVSATTEDEKGIESITLPDGTAVSTTKTEYTVNKNGDYEFKATGKNGEETTSKITVSNIQEISQIKPYIPTGFSYVEGENQDGYVIQDSYGNQFVWVPVLNSELTRTNMNSTEFIEEDVLTSEFINSVIKNNGFYIGRYEAGVTWNRQEVVEQYENPETKKVEERVVEKDVGIINVKPEQVPWTNITYTDAYNVARDMKDIYGYQNLTTSLINSYAWDTTLKWIDKTTNNNFSVSTQNGNYTNELAYTGTTEKDVANRIFDLSGNVREWSTEIYKPQVQDTNSNEVGYRVIRGGCVTLNKTPSSFNSYQENQSAVYWGFRVLLFK